MSIQQTIDVTRLYKRFPWEWELEEEFNELQPLSGFIMATLEADPDLDDDELVDRVFGQLNTLLATAMKNNRRQH